LFWQHLSGRVRQAIDDESINDESINDESINDESINDESINAESIDQSIDHESAEDESPSVRWWTRRSWRWALAGVAAVVIATLVVVTNTRSPRTDRVADRATSSTPPLASGVPDDLSWTPPSDDSWTMVVGMAEGLDLDSAADAGLTVRPGSVDQAVLAMSDEEQRDLAGIIQAELDRLSL
jgi:DNA polymerase-3 subunit gamma/tau